MKKVYIVGAKRTAIGSFLGTLKDQHPAQLGAKVLSAICNEIKLPLEAINEVLVGNVLPAGLGQGIARQVSINAGVPVTVPACTVNMVCGSGMKTIMNGFMAISLGMHQVVAAGGAETMSMAPFILSQRARTGQKLGNMSADDHILCDALTDVFNKYHMGITAENIAQKYDISREEQDAFALVSQQRALAAVDSNRFADEVVPIEIAKRRETIIFEQDEYPNRSTSAEKLAKLRPAFQKDGTVTAGNASGINDGASMVVLASEEAVKKYKLAPLAEIIAVGQGGVDPSIMGMGPVPAIAEALNSADMRLSDMNLLELNEAFAAQSLGVIKELCLQHNVEEKWLLENTNVNGGAISLGHPVGTSGNRIVVTLLHEMKKRGLTHGLASLCIGGGMGTAVIVKSINS